MRVKIPDLDTLSCYIDRLGIQLQKIHTWEGLKREEQLKQNKDIQLIAYYDHKSRESNEIRFHLKNKIDELFAEVIKAGEYKYLSLDRSFQPPEKSLGEVLDQRIYALSAVAKEDLEKEIAEYLVSRT